MNGYREESTMSRVSCRSTVRLTVICLVLWPSLPADAADLPDLHHPLRTDAEAPHDAAILIGIEEYAFLPDVPYALRDVQMFEQFLIHTRGVPSDRVDILDATTTCEKMEAAVQAAAARVEPGGTLWVYFSGHGAASSVDDRHLLLAMDALAETESFETRSLSVDDLQSIAGASKAEHVILVLDTCYTGRSRDGSELLEGRRYAVPNAAIQAHERVLAWSASAPSETSAPYEPVEQGVFTYFLVGAMRGWADGELDGSPDGKVTLVEAKAYVERALRKISGSTQHPELDHPEDLGELALTTAIRSESGPDLNTAPRVVGMGDQDGGFGEIATQVAVRTREFQDLARSDFKKVEAVTRGGGPEGQAMLDEFIVRYGEAGVSVSGKTYPVRVQEVDQARAMLASYEGYWEKERQRKAGTALVVIGGIAASAGTAVAIGFSVERQSALGLKSTQDWYMGWAVGGTATAATGGALVVVGIINLGKASRKSAHVAFVPGPVTTFSVWF